MNHKKKLTNYVSDLDQFLNHFDKTHEPSAVQRKEKDKFRRIYALRDTEERPDEPSKTLWDEF